MPQNRENIRVDNERVSAGGQPELILEDQLSEVFGGKCVACAECQKNTAVFQGDIILYIVKNLLSAARSGAFGDCCTIGAFDTIGAFNTVDTFGTAGIAFRRCLVHIIAAFGIAGNEKKHTNAADKSGKSRNE